MAAMSRGKDTVEREEARGKKHSHKTQDRWLAPVVLRHRINGRVDMDISHGEFPIPEGS